MPTEPLCLVFTPALVTLLQAAENRKGSPLTEPEALAIRDEAICVAVPFSAAFDMDQKRGYQDIVAEDCWNEWQPVRLSN